MTDSGGSLSPGFMSPNPMALSNCWVTCSALPRTSRPGVLTWAAISRARKETDPKSPGA
ncbi:hypothetical protein PUN71_018260 [Arthrobacter sp. NQ7]|uniref:hypothetical protein n=1 Tax=Arthrobacter sp. NQ7 TaxID=3032303 RepID=UPI0024BAA0D4|nr:hypothetical protein [Arthrobacter sp. NQ7]MDJ0459150.1 hypothetical protein [Arthrobacter sp. NQ7]